jgi:hypothetical protein
MLPLQAQVGSALCLALGLALIITSLSLARPK